MTNSHLPRIFVYLTSDEPGFQCAVALAEDGTAIASHISSSIAWSEKDMGLDALYPASAKHASYAQHYPNGYQLINLLKASESDLRSNSAFMLALDLHTIGLANDDFGDPPER